MTIANEGDSEKVDALLAIIGPAGTDVSAVSKNFKAGGEAHIERPKQPTELSDSEWAEYLFMRKNIKGIQLERWNHAHGCRKWFNAVRDTGNDEIKAIYKMGEKPPII